MNEESAQKVFAELFPYFEAVEAQSAAILQLLKEKGLATEEELAPYLEQAAKSSSVRWSAVRARMNYLLARPSTYDRKGAAKEHPNKAEEELKLRSGEREEPDQKNDPQEMETAPVADNSRSEKRAAEGIANQEQSTQRKSDETTERKKQGTEETREERSA